MRRRFQDGSVKKKGRNWVLQWWEDGHRRKRSLPVSEYTTLSEAKTEMAAILGPINARSATPSAKCTVGDFVAHAYLPFYRRKWKRTTCATNEDRLKNHLIPAFDDRTVGSLTRNELQGFLDDKARVGLSYSLVAHLRWDLKQILGMAVAEGFLSRNPAQLLFIPRECPRPDGAVMQIEEVMRMFGVLNTRERLIAKLAVVSGLRPGEIFGLTWARLNQEYADIQQRVYRGDVDTPKTHNSVRHAALSDGVIAAIDEWRTTSFDSSAEAWVFPSEKLVTPMSKDNCWRREFLPRLKAVGLQWVNFQVMRRTHSSLMADMDVDPKVRAEQMGHSVDVNMNVYTQTSMGRRRSAVNALKQRSSCNWSFLEQGIKREFVSF